MKRILSTFLANLFSVIISFLLLIITAKHLGSVGRGTISLVSAQTAIIQIFCGVIGASVIYILSTKYRYANFVLLSYCWSLAVNIIYIIIIYCLTGTLHITTFYIAIIGFFASAYIINSLLLINVNKIDAYNLIKLSQPLLTICILLAIGINTFNVNDYFNSIIISYIISIGISFFFLKNIMGTIEIHSLPYIFKYSMKYGGLNQLSNVIQAINYRFSFFILSKNFNLSVVGIFGLLITLVDTIWLFCTTVSMLLHRDISKQDDLAKNFILTEKTAKISAIGTCIFITFGLLLPNSVYVYILSKDFIEVKSLLLLFSPAIIIFSVAKVISHYFSGKGLIKWNVLSALGGAVFTIGIGTFVIPYWGLKGAVLTNSVAYIITSIILFYYYCKEKKNTSVDLNADEK